MNEFYKLVNNGYIIAIGTKGNETTIEISQSEYENILEIIHSKPQTATGYDYRLKEDLTWKWYETSSESENEPTIEDKAEAYDILTGVVE